MANTVSQRERPPVPAPTPGPARSRIVLASGNAGKLVEMRGILDGLGIELVTQRDLGIDDAEETGATFVENALLKARHAARWSGLPAIGDDSGLCVQALDGAPGLLSARYAGVHGDSLANIAKLLEALRDVPESHRGAHFHCCAVFVEHAQDPVPLIAEGRWAGRILDAPRGSGGFGYDPVFFDPQHKQSAAQLDPVVKNRVSHRGIALAHLRRLLQARSRA